MMFNDDGDTWASFITWAIFVIAGMVLWFAWMFIGNAWVTGDGISTDYIMGVESSGIIWRTYDVYLRNEHPTSGNAGRYCLPPELSGTLQSAELVALQEAAKNNSVCKLYYKSTLSTLPWRCNEGNAIIYKVEC